MSRNSEIAILAGIIAITVVTSLAVGFDVLGLIVLTICLLCLGLLLADRGGD